MNFPDTSIHAAALLFMTFLPIIAGLIIPLLPGRGSLARGTALGAAIVTLLVSFGFISGIFADPGQYHAYVNVPWLPKFGVTLLMGMDGLSGTLVLLTNILFVLAILGSWTAIHHRESEFYCFLLMLQTGILGTFLALDLILFYIFWELMLVPLYFLIGIFGSKNRIYATLKFFLYTMAGSMLMLVGILYLGFAASAKLGHFTFAYPELLKFTSTLPLSTQWFLFLSFFIAFAIKAPLWPLHTWLPDAHTEAPTAGSVILAGVLLKTGIYGMLRFAIPMFPAQAAHIAPLVMALSVIAIVYGALAAFAQKDLKRLVAYSSVSHMGFIVLGIFAFKEVSVTGAALQMLNHGISTGALFLCVGYIYERRHTRELAAFGGLAFNMKLYAVLTTIVVLSSVGLPGLNGFVGEFMILLGTYQARAWWAVVSATGVILAACYLLKMMQYTFFGPLDKEENKELKDLNGREAFTLIVLIVMAVWIGLYPNPCINALKPSSQTVTKLVSEAPSTERTVAISQPNP